MLFQRLCRNIAGSSPTKKAATEAPACQRRAANPMIRPGGAGEDGVGEGRHHAAEEEDLGEVAAGLADSAMARPK